MPARARCVPTKATRRLFRGFSSAAVGVCHPAAARRAVGAAAQRRVGEDATIGVICRPAFGCFLALAPSDRRSTRGVVGIFGCGETARMLPNSRSDRQFRHRPRNLTFGRRIRIFNRLSRFDFCRFGALLCCLEGELILPRPAENGKGVDQSGAEKRSRCSGLRLGPDVGDPVGSSLVRVGTRPRDTRLLM